MSFGFWYDDNTLSPNDQGDVTFSFTGNPVNAFGLQVYDADVNGDFIGGQTVSFVIDGQTYSFVPTATFYFLGVITSTPFTSVTVSVPDFVEYNYLVAGNNQCPSGSISGDPHFVGFGGEKYNILGENMKWFNLISAADFQMNALFQSACEGKKDITAMSSLTINMHGTKLLLNVSGASIDESPIAVRPRPHPYLAGEKGIYGTIVHPWENYFEVSTGEFSLIIERQLINHAEQKPGWLYYGEKCLDAYFNIRVRDQNISLPLHGLLGQTAHHSHSQMVDDKDKEGKGEIEGSYKDYIVSGPFANDFKFNMYKN